jgi:hypothetical protein
MTNVEISYIIASCTSAILAIVAIVLSIIFFRMSLGFSESAKEASKSISACVGRVEKLFDKLYADTFSMMKETYSDIRKHMWPEESTNTDKITEEAEIKAEEKISSFKSEMDKELLKMFQKQKITDKKLSSTRDEMRHLLDKAISSSRRLEIEAREETVRDQIRRLIKRLPKVSAVTIVDKLSISFSPNKVIEEIREMAREGELSLSEDHLGPKTIITLRR